MSQNLGALVLLLLITSYAKQCLVPIVLIQEETNLFYVCICLNAGIWEIVGAIENNCCVQSGALTRS